MILPQYLQETITPYSNEAYHHVGVWKGVTGEFVYHRSAGSLSNENPNSGPTIMPSIPRDI
jgi:hypothetical protein